MPRLRVDLLFTLAPLLALTGCELFSVSPTDASLRKKNYGTPLAPGEVALEKVTDPALYPDFGAGFGGDGASLIKAIDGTIEYFGKPSSQQWFPYLDIDHARALQSLHAFKAVVQQSSSAEDLNRRIADGFDVYRSKGWDGSGTMLFTGYCQPIFDATTEKTGAFQYPLYSRPPELLKDEHGTPIGWDQGGEPGASPTRRDIDEGGALAGRGLEIYWMKDELERYIVHVQGSAKLRMPDGSMRSIGYGGKTEHAYVGLGETLVKEGNVPTDGLNLRAVKQFVASNPDKGREYMYRNESYVFFTEINGGPYGSMNIEVTPYRTLATDKKIYTHQGKPYTIFPRGGVAFIETRVPNQDGMTAAFDQFVLDQDTGGAIQSAGRADLFVGTGPEAEEVAGDIYSEGYAWYIYAKPQ